MKRTESQTKPYQTFEDLEAYQVARGFRKAMSLTNNIAEGHGRFHFLDQIKFMLQARGSLEELLDDLNICTGENYLPEDEIQKLKSEGWRTHKLINGYIRFLRSRTPGESSRIREHVSDDDLNDNDLEDLFFGRFNPSSLQRFNE